MNKDIKHVFFDLDHTLWDFDKNSSLTFDKIFKEKELQITVDEFLKVYLPINLNYWRLYREDKISKSDLRYGRLKDTFNAVNYTISDTLIHQISEDYINYLSEFNYLLDGAIEILEYLQPKYQLHIITNGFEEVQNLKLQKSGILSYFNQIITSEKVGAKKPNPKVFQFSLSEANAEAKQSIMIGDSFEADVMGALHSNMNAIYYAPNGNNKSEIVSISSLLQLKKYL